MIVAGNGYNCLSKFVFDGDTLKLEFKKFEFTARLQWIDCPETQKFQKSTEPAVLKHWAWAERAKTALMDMVYQKSIIAVPLEKDQFDRWVCDCYIQSVKASNNIQIQLCKAGLAVTYLPFNRFSYSTRELAVIRGIITETARANRRKLGIWSELDFILPADFKKLTF
ncbi:MAG: thermonuclease family protein [Microcoleus sp.]